MIDGLTGVQAIANGCYELQPDQQSEGRPIYRQRFEPSASVSGDGDSQVRCWLYYAGGAWLLSPALAAEECYGYLPSKSTVPSDATAQSGGESAVWLVPAERPNVPGDWGGCRPSVLRRCICGNQKWVCDVSVYASCQCEGFVCACDVPALSDGTR